jgi:hypothetical protein
VLASSNDNALPKVELSDLIQIWSFGLEHAGEFVPDLCVAYLAKNFVCTTHSSHISFLVALGCARVLHSMICRMYDRKL